MAKKKDKNTVVLADAVTNLREQIDLNSGPEDGTVVRFDYTFESKGKTDYGRKVKRRYYTYAAIWIADTNCWHLTGRGNLTETQNNREFMALLASSSARRVKVATVLDAIK